MQSKYILKKTIGQTIKANPQLEKILPMNAEKYNKHFLYDFSILDNAEIDAEAKSEIKTQLLRNFKSVAFRECSVFATCDIYTSFDWYSGSAYVKPYPCYTEDGKQAYVIMELVRLDLMFEARTSIYSEWEITKKLHLCSANNNAIEDLNIA